MPDPQAQNRLAPDSDEPSGSDRKIRFGSIVLAGLSICACLALLYVVPKFDAIFKDLNLPLPGLTRFITYLSSNGIWSVFALLAVLVLAKDLHAQLSLRAKLLNTLVGFGLMLLFFAGTIGLFLPMIGTITQINADCRATPPQVSAPASVE